MYSIPVRRATDYQFVLAMFLRLEKDIRYICGLFVPEFIDALIACGSTAITS